MECSTSSVDVNFQAVGGAAQDVKLKGQACLEKHQKALFGVFDLSKFTGLWKQDVYDRQYEDFFRSRENQLAHYFRLLYTIVKCVDQTHSIGDEDRKFYTNIVRAQLSSAELVLLLFNGLSLYGQKFKPY